MNISYPVEYGGYYHISKQMKYVSMKSITPMVYVGVSYEAIKLNEYMSSAA